MRSNHDRGALKRQSLTALLLIILTFALLLPLAGIAEDDGAILPNPDPPTIFNGGESSSPDSTYTAPEDEPVAG